MDDFLINILVDPIDKIPLRMVNDVLQSTCGRTFPIIQRIPIMLVDGIDQTIRVAEKTLYAARQRVDSDSADTWCIDTTAIDDLKLQEVKRLLANGMYRGKYAGTATKSEFHGPSTVFRGPGFA